MGNCCSHKNGSSKSKYSKDHYQNTYAPARTINSDAGYIGNGNHGMVKQPMNGSRHSGIYDRQASTNNLQHISEREPEDAECDPSVNALTETIFIKRSSSDAKHRNNRRRRSHYDNHHHVRDYGRLTRKYNSCSTIFIDNSTVSQPNLKNTIRAVALAIYFHIKNRDGRTRDALPPSLLAARYSGDPQAAALAGVDLEDIALFEIFDEKLHPLSKDPVADDYYRRDPEHKSIYRFISKLFRSAQLTAECAIVTLVYLERLLTYGDMEIAPYNWKRIVLGAVLLASKVWDDQAVWNVDYCQILKDMTVEDMNELERHFLETLQFNINVPSSVYAKYYFDLRALADAHDLSFPYEPLSKDRAVKLEAMSSSCEDKLRLSHTLRRAHSLDGLAGNPRHSKAILS